MVLKDQLLSFLLFGSINADEGLFKSNGSVRNMVPLDLSMMLIDLPNAESRYPSILEIVFILFYFYL